MVRCSSVCKHVCYVPLFLLNPVVCSAEKGLKVNVIHFKSVMYLPVTSVLSFVICVSFLLA